MSPLEKIAKLLPDPLEDASQVAPRRPWIIRYGSRTAVLRATDLDAVRPLGFTQDMLHASLKWLHDLLSDLHSAGFVAPTPLAELGGQSIVAIDGTMWELLTFVPGRPMGWSDHEMERAGRQLARLHEALARLPAREQRPGALPIESCRPLDPTARRIQLAVLSDLADLGYERGPQTVIHGDATQANVVVDGEDFAFVDYTIAYIESDRFDVASALWRNGRVEANAVRYDVRRASVYVAGYSRERRLDPSDAGVIVALMKARGIQLQHRLELRKGADETVLQRLVAIADQSAELVDAIAGAIESEPAPNQADGTFRGTPRNGFRT